MKKAKRGKEGEFSDLLNVCILMSYNPIFGICKTYI